jgi:tetratricopeptide (TPR) repeat protein
MMRVRAKFLAPVLALSLPAACLLGETQQNDPQSQRAMLHQTAQWAQIQPHLPAPDTASPAVLETAGDVLRARRFPDDALDYYKYALSKGGNAATLKNKIGVVQLDLHQSVAARASFLAAIQANKDYAPAWNNLGVADSLSKNYSHAIKNYQHAAKLDGVTATYHANAGMAYFEMKDIDHARQQLTAAIQIDPEVMQKPSESGVDIQMFNRDNYGEFCFQMARLFAEQKDIEQVHLWLTKAKGSGYDVRGAMRFDVALSPDLKDPDVQMMLSNRSPAHRQAVSGVSDGSAPMQRNFN